MKKICIILLAALFTGHVFAQAPEQMSYQAVIRNTNSQLVVNTNVGIRISILKGLGSNKINVYSETQTTYANQDGLVSLQIGTGVTTDRFPAIDWSTGPYFIHTETDPTGGTNYTIDGISQLVSVPYALYAKTAGFIAAAPGVVLEDNRSPSYIDFADAAGFALYTTAGAIANTGTTSLQGNVGSNAGAISGFETPSLLAGGTIHIGDSATARAARSLQAAYIQLKNRVPTVIAHSAAFGSVSGETLYPGVYTVTAAINVSGKLVLDGNNLPAAQFIIRTAGAFTVAAGTTIALVNGATAANVFWVSEGAVAIGGNATMSGVVIANNAAVSIAAGGTLDGRIYTTAGAIAISGTNGVGLSYIIPLRIMPNADIVIKRNVSIGADLNVDSSAYLNKIGGSTTNYGAFTVERKSATMLTGRLTVNGTTTLVNTLDVTGATHLDNTLLTDGATTLGSTLNVAAATTLGSTLDVTGATHLDNTLLTDGATTLGNTLDVTGATHLKSTLLTDAATTLGTTLDVKGASTFENNATFSKNIAVTGSMSSTSLLVSDNNPNFVASFENKNGDTGDGLVIKLGKTHPAFKGSDYLNIVSASDIFDDAIGTVKGWIIDKKKFSPSQLLTLIPKTLIPGLATNVFNLITDQLNINLGLPVTFPAITTPEIRFPQINDPITNSKLIGSFQILPPQPIISAFTFIPSIPTVDITGLPSLKIPQFSFTNVTNSLSNDNQFLSFKDKSDRELGSVRAQSITDWEVNYLDDTYFVKLMAGIVGIDVASGMAGIVAGFSDLAKAYNSIGVEYASGHGDYAEWLERSDSTEIISAGDIVAVKAGKISKDLKGAEQILVVSHNPIVLGNTPAENKEAYGNKIAFMGQVPVKVQGPVASGDYIIAKSGMVGYGIAVHADKMTDSDYKLSIGRSWESNLNDGPKMVNTLIGVDNGNYFSILKKSKDQTSVLEAKTVGLEKRMKVLEAHMNALLIAAPINATNKKPIAKLKGNTLK